MNRSKRLNPGRKKAQRIAGTGRTARGTGMAYATSDIATNQQQRSSRMLMKGQVNA